MLMKAFLLQIALFIALLATSFLFVFSLADGNSDPYYVRFTTPKQHSLILGTSRAAQGLQPSVINDLFSKSGKKNIIFNFAFNNLTSPYGKTYFKSIKNKIKPNVTDGIYIIAVDPWSISSNTQNPNDSLNYTEMNLALEKIKHINLKPNIFYLINSYDEPFINILIKKRYSSGKFLHNDGWLEVNYPMDSVSVKHRFNDQINEYIKTHMPNFKYSNVRYRYLAKTIEYLQLHGTVYLTRLPVHPKMMDLENELMPYFDTHIKLLSDSFNVEYINIKDDGDKYEYIDSDHLYKASGKIVSAKIAERILNHQRKLRNRYIN